MQKNTTSLGSMNWDDLKFFLEVARTRKTSIAAKRPAVDYTTVSRRISSLEASLGTLLFEKSRTTGFPLTAEGQRLLSYAESIESTLHMACEQVSGSGMALSGHVRMGCTEGFGSFFITPQLSHFVDTYPAISVDILPLPHFISLSKLEADIVIALERPKHGPYGLATCYGMSKSPIELVGNSGLEQPVTLLRFCLELCSSHAVHFGFFENDMQALYFMICPHHGLSLGGYQLLPQSDFSELARMRNLTVFVERTNTVVLLKTGVHHSRIRGQIFVHGAVLEVLGCGGSD